MATVAGFLVAINIMWLPFPGFVYPNLAIKLGINDTDTQMDESERDKSEMTQSGFCLYIYVRYGPTYYN